MKSSKTFDYFKLSISQYGTLPSEVNSVSGISQISGPLWLSPQAIKSLEKAKKIDQDPLTGVVTEVVYAGKLQDGTNAVMLQQGNETYLN